MVVSNDPLETLNIDLSRDLDFDIDVIDDGDEEFDKLQHFIHENAPPPER